MATADGRNPRPVVRARGGMGRFVRTPDTAERDARACRLRAQGVSYRDIATELDMANPGNAYHAVQRAMLAIVAEPAAELRQLELERLDMVLMEAARVMRSRHLVVSNGRVVLDPASGEPLIDPMPRLHAADRILKVGDQRAKLLGLYAPTRVENVTPEEVEATLLNFEREIIDSTARETA